MSDVYELTPSGSSRHGRPTASCADRGWDFGDPEGNHATLRKLFQEQCAFAWYKSPFWRSRLQDCKAALCSNEFDVKQIPLTYRQELRSISPYDLLPSRTDTYHMCRGTGGTTGPPLRVFWTLADWTAAIQAISRYMSPLNKLRPLIAWNAYHQGHAAGPSFDDVIRFLGGTPLARHFRSRDVDALDDIRRMRANVLVITPQGGSGKGGSLEDLLTEDHSFLSRLKIDALLLSSTELTAELLHEVRQQGVTTIINLYGCSESFPVAISCPVDPLTLHLCPGPNFIEVVDSTGDQVQSGHRGLVVVSRVASVTSHGLHISRGTQLIRYVIGDSAQYIGEGCACGRTTPRICAVRRVVDTDEKIAGGCEQWE
jgi:phenylacetate-coenzyme A ligase PaaK-like adenylate-forming protein